MLYTVNYNYMLHSCQAPNKKDHKPLYDSIILNCLLIMFDSYLVIMITWI
jgi:hypothetical protein